MVGERKSLEKEKCLGNSYTAARVFFQCCFRSGTEILMAVCSFWIFFLESFLERGFHISMNGKFIFSGRFIFRWRGHPIGVASALMGGERAKRFMEWEAHQS